MANLFIGGIDCGAVLEYQDESEFPCIDTNYRERTLRFIVLKNFTSYEQMVSFDDTTIPSYFSSRTKSVSYSGISGSFVLQSFKKKSRLSPIYAEYEVILTKEG